MVIVCGLLYSRIRVTGLYSFCNGCGHGGHVDCMSSMSFGCFECGHDCNNGNSMK